MQTCRRAGRRRHRCRGRAGGAFDWALLDRVPLAAAIDATADRPARIVIFRRPLERRASDRTDLRDLVHLTLVEQLSALTGRSMHDLDPQIDEDY